MLTIELITEDDVAWRDEEALRPLIERAAEAATARAALETGKTGPFAININLSSDAEVRTLNKQYRGKDSATNILSFPFENEFEELFPGPQLLGDLILAKETVQREAEEEGKPLANHVAHLVVHGVLHLFGHDHMETQEAEEMEELEQEILSTLGIPSPYANQAIDDTL